MIQVGFKVGVASDSKTPIGNFVKPVRWFTSIKGDSQIDR